jgi:hypothetical protein
MSFKFSSSPPARKRPWVCKPSPPEAAQRELAASPIELQAWIDYVDLDPLFPHRGTAYFPLVWIPAVPHYYGAKPTPEVNFVLTIARTPTSAVWQAKLQVSGAFPGPVSFVYPGLFIDPDKPFDTGLFGDIVLAGQDFRRIRIME